MEEKNENKEKIKPKNKKNKINFVFSTTYWIILIIFLALTIFESRLPVGDSGKKIVYIIVLVILEILFILMFVQNLIQTKNKKKIILSFLCYIINAVISVFFWLFKTDITYVILFAYNTILLIYLLIDFWLYKTKYKTAKFFDKKMPITICFIFIVFFVNLISHSYLNDKIFLYSLIPFGIIMIIFFILGFTIFRQIFQIFAKNVWTKIGVVIIALVLSYSYSLLFIDILNTSFNKNFVRQEYVIVDKRVSRSNRGMTTHYKLYIVVDEQKISIEVSKDTYYSKEINDTLLIKYNNGNLKLNYLESLE